MELVIFKTVRIVILSVKSEIQLSKELGLNLNFIRNTRKKSLARSLWTKSQNMVFYTEQGEHSIRNELMKRIFAKVKTRK
ncbi:MAG: hypothetical protein CMI24_06295 [Opitutae bacterium]|nr:hypothetical protein [Opitutae bacterium]